MRRTRHLEHRRLLALASAAIASFAAALPAQDIEAVARLQRRQLPAGYYEAKRKLPDRFELGGGWISRAARAQVVADPVAGRLPVVVIPALFSNSAAPPFSADQLQRALFDGPAPFGTLSGYYAEASYGRLTVAGRVTPWVRTNLTLQEVVGDSYGLGETARTREYLLSALAKADGAIDFGQFDNDGPDGVPNSGDDDGRVDAAAFLFAEPAASCGGPAIWPHRSRLSAWATYTLSLHDALPI